MNNSILVKIEIMEKQITGIHQREESFNQSFKQSSVQGTNFEVSFDPNDMLYSFINGIVKYLEQTINGCKIKIGEQSILIHTKTNKRLAAIERILNYYLQFSPKTFKYQRIKILRGKTVFLDFVTEEYQNEVKFKYNVFTHQQREQTKNQRKAKSVEKLPILVLKEQEKN